MSRRGSFVIALLMASCHPSPLIVRAPHGGRFDVTAASFQALDNQRVAVSVTRAMGQQSKTGVVILRRTPMSEAEHSVLVRIAAARAWLMLCHSDIDPVQAWVAAQRGVAELGVEYLFTKRRIHDDTSNDVHIAELFESRGDLAGATQRMSDVLKKRIMMYARVFSDQVEPD
jgi:hypothetical protein